STGKSVAAPSGGKPARLFPADFVAVGIRVRGEQHLFRNIFQPLTNRRRESRGRQKQRLERIIEVYVRLGQQRRNFTSVRPASVKHDELRFSKVGIVEYRFQKQRIYAGDIEVAAGSCHGMDMYGHPEPSALRRNIAEEKILKLLVFHGGRRRLSDVSAVYLCG